MTRGSKVGLAIAAVVASSAALAYAWNVAKNAEARDRVERACERIRAARAERWAVLEEPARALFQDDVDEIGALFGSLGEPMCVGLEAELGSVLAWNAGRTWQGEPMDPEQLARLRAAAERARERCPALMREALSVLSRDDAALDRSAREACEGMMSDFDAYAAAPRETPEPIALWDWPERLESLASALEQE